MSRVKVRLDQLLVDQNIVPNLQVAQGEIRSGNVLVNDQKVDKPGYAVLTTVVIRLIKERFPYVSRGALKLQGAHQTFGFQIKDKVALDVGQSTGGFSDYLLQNGAKFVYGVDVGYGQVDLKVRDNPNCCVIERMNARYLSPADLEKAPQFSGQISLVVMDLSFISVTKVLPQIKLLVQPETDFIILVKPQFEARKGEVPEGGIIRDSELQEAILVRVLDELKGKGFKAKAQCLSPVEGTKGNREFLVWLNVAE